MNLIEFLGDDRVLSRPIPPPPRIINEGQYKNFGKESTKLSNMDNLIIGKILKSKKAWYAIAAITIPIIATKLGVDETSVQNVFYAILTLIVAQGAADWGKEKK